MLPALPLSVDYKHLLYVMELRREEGGLFQYTAYPRVVLLLTHIVELVLSP